MGILRKWRTGLLLVAGLAAGSTLAPAVVSAVSAKTERADISACRCM
jgi:hypothetical protein